MYYMFSGADNGRVSTEAAAERKPSFINTAVKMDTTRWTHINSVCRSCVRRKEGGTEDSRVIDGNRRGSSRSGG